jgi:ribosomal protein S11
MKNSERQKIVLWTGAVKSFTSRDKSSEYLARFYALNCIKKAKKFIVY